ncbi:F0F1 ATP synthase subunit epsilon [Actinomyces sp. zg-332]|uniref:F0F1 ATP synthase subunit epsilon n=1 Tax=Actinomyces sp. zg-332 TaxID=2708340 RepID=UPI00142088E1|nr:F0F1 ATP synthase subunit epsilon [Actinomyces sp. zg-332]QPK94505.1 F0F1 ATP synthase subunit epsilon [Actinomyces sp. zg-332]
MALDVRVVSDKEELWYGQATYIGLMTGGGSIGILPGHQPVLATVVAGKAQIHTTKGDKIELPVGEGILSVDQDIVNIVVNHVSDN